MQVENKKIFELKESKYFTENGESVYVNRNRRATFEIFSFRQEIKKEIFLLSNDSFFLKEKWQLIADYTKKVDPKAKIGKFEILELEAGDGDFTKAVALHDILPRPLRILYGSHELESQWNCHGTALVAAGFYPAMSYCKTPNQYNEKIAKKIPLNDVASGDLVCMPGHSLVYLDQDFCISRNGVGRILDIYPTYYVLESYGCPGDLLTNEKKQAEWADSVTVLRKDKDWSYPEDIMPELMEYYEYRNFSLRCNYPNGEYYPHILAIFKKIGELAIEKGGEYKKLFGDICDDDRPKKDLLEDLDVKIVEMIKKRYFSY